MRRPLGAAAVAIALAAGPMHAASAQSGDLIVVEVAPVAGELARHLQVSPDRIPSSVDLPSKVAAAVCHATLKQLRESGGGQGRCVAVSMSQGLIQAVRQAMRGG